MEKRTASVIIIGGGIMACAAAYSLAMRGMKDILVLERKEIGNGGSCRNAGGVRQSARDARELPLAMYAVNHIWPTLSEELGIDVEYVQKGNLRLGQTPAHEAVLAALTENSAKCGLDVKMISGYEARSICPYMSEAVTSASWCPTDGHANPLRATLGYYRKDLELGVTFVTGVTVTGIRKVRGNARIVLTDDGIYEGEHIVVCAGWDSRAILNTVCIDIPTHGVGLAIVTPAWMRYVLNNKTLDRFVMFARNVWSVEEPDPYKAAVEGIDKTAAFFRELGMPALLKEVGIGPEHFEVMAEEAVRVSGIAKRSFCLLNRDDIVNIFKSCLE